ncbi:MAG: diadenosine tetraphosphate hydrolase, partial [Lacrimispora sp.]|nr:diadenosine tetraphosphate hydrolase [Lacrimispora sp.]
MKELETGYVVLGDHQRFQGYTLFLCKEHASELHFLEKEFKNRFLQEMALTAEAVYRAFGPDKLNY